jgi:radical SAM superfamily enzyme YgiQ (UPF0313 family)
MCDALGILTEATLIIGAPEDTEETIDETARLIGEIEPDVIDLHFLNPTPGSSLYSKYKEGRVLKYSNRRIPDRYTSGLLHSTLKKGELNKAYWVVIRSWLKRKSLWRTKAYWRRWWLGLRGYRAKGEGLVRWLIYHNYFWHRVLKEAVWWWRRRTGERTD